MTDFTTPEQASDMTREWRDGYHEGREYEAFQRGITISAQRERIADLSAEAAKWQRLYLEAVSELAVNRAVLGYGETLPEAVKAAYEGVTNEPA